MIGALATAAAIAVIHATAWPMTGHGKIDNATVIIRNGKIASVEAGGTPPADARVIDAKGAIVTPGLMNPATQLGLVETGQADETNDMATSNAGLGAGFDIQYALNANSVLLPVARADGLTRAVTYPSGSGSAPFTGQAAVIDLNGSEDILDQAQVALYAQVGSASLSGAGGSRAGQWQLLRNALSDARDAVKPQDAKPTRDQRALARVLDGTVPLVILAQRESDLRQAVALSHDFNIHVVVMGADEAWRCADALASAHIAVVLDPMDDLPISFDQIGARLDNAAILDKAGVKTAFYSSGKTIYLSYNAGLGMREAAGLAVANGLDYEHALAAITRTPAEIFGIAGHYGTLAPGMDADLVLWDGDPLEPSSAPTKVFVRGIEASLVTRQTQLRDRYYPAPKPGDLPAEYRK
jgi:imidazolonepropionase-like amidohydrolase